MSSPLVLDGVDETLASFSELDAQLADLTKPTAANVLYKALFGAAARFDTAWRIRVPKFTGQLSRGGGVAKAAGAIGYAAYSSALRQGKDKASAVAAMRQALRETRDQRSFAEVVAGPSRDPAGIQVEFGNSHQAPEPFMRPSWEETKGPMFQDIRKSLAGAVPKAAERARRKAARILAQAGG